MPQLYPSPWLYIFVFSWIILLLMSPKKIMSHAYPNDPSPKYSKTLNSSWPWLW
uniref:ATP synthase F0 subunit 8 n=1 Tax=Ptychadena nuerensis TaxID=2039362 RepID=UPI00286D27D7|nr:ATP synthase F0 subunit 8 [Ptychadena nuerensis]WKT09030.1 ATP synthase F0 subunit 8 [Ptychadena nuerensis]